MKGRAVILEIKNGVCTVLTDQGDFRKIRLKGNLLPGQLVTLPESRWRAGRVLLVAAVLLVFLFSTVLWKGLVSPAVAAYVSLEVNPAVELGLDKDGVVREIRPLDPSGGDLTAGLELKGVPLAQAVESIISEAVKRQYISFGEGNTVVSTVTPVGDFNPSELDRQVRETVETSLRGQGVTARVLVGQASAEIRDKAGKEGISTGRYMLFLEASEKGIQVDPEDFRSKKIYSIEKDRKIKFQDLRVKVEKESHDLQDGGQVDNRNSRGQDRPGDGPRGNGAPSPEKDRDKVAPGREKKSGPEAVEGLEQPARQDQMGKNDKKEDAPPAERGKGAKTGESLRPQPGKAGE